MEAYQTVWLSIMEDPKRLENSISRKTKINAQKT